MFLNNTMCFDEGNVIQKAAAICFLKGTVFAFRFYYFY